MRPSSENMRGGQAFVSAGIRSRSVSTEGVDPTRPVLLGVRHLSYRTVDAPGGTSPRALSRKRLLHRQADLRPRQLVYPPMAQRGGAYHAAPAPSAQYPDGDIADEIVTRAMECKGPPYG